MDLNKFLTDLSDRNPEGNRMTSQPWQMALHGEQWAVATDGRMCIAAKGSRGFAAADDKKTETITTLLSTRYDGESCDCETSVLRAWCGEYEGAREIACRECQGTGKCSHCGEGDCDRCDGEGNDWEWPDMRLGTILGFPVDRNKLARILQVVDSESVRVVRALPERDGAPLRLEAVNVVALVMGVAGSETDVYVPFETFALPSGVTQ